MNMSILLTLSLNACELRYCASPEGCGMAAVRVISLSDLSSNSKVAPEEDCGVIEPFGGAIEAQRTRSQRVRNDTTLIQCYPAAKLIITVVPYYLFACLYYCLNERKPCERPLAGEEATCRERWTVIDALYFTTASIATVGYGDLYVESGPSRAFTAAWMLVGWSVVLSQVAMVFRGLFEGFGRLMRYLIDKIDGDVDLLRHRAGGESGNVYAYYARELFAYTVLYVGMQVLFGTLMLFAEEHFSVGDMAWYCFVTATTVGYGDINAKTQLGRLYASLHIMLSVIWLAAIVGHVVTLHGRRQRLLQYEAMMRRRIDAKAIRAMDCDGTGVDRIEFLVRAELLRAP